MRAPTRLRPFVAAATATALAATCLSVIVPSAASAYAGPAEWDGMILDARGAAIVDDVEHVEIAPGLDQLEFERIGREGRQQLNVLRVALADSNLHVDYIGNDAVTDPGTVTEFVDGAGAIAGVNGDFFDINNSSAPLGVAISREDGVMKSPEVNRDSAVAFSESGLGRIANILIEGTVTTPGGDLPLHGLNTLSATRDAVTVYNQHWGDHTRTRPIPAGATGVEVLVGADGVVTAAAAAPGAAQLADGEMALVAIDGGPAAAALQALAPGDAVALEYRVDDENADIRAAVSGHPSSEPLMLENGVVGEAVSPLMRERHPRTGVGFSADGTTAYFVVADGRQANAAGLTVPELGQLMLDLGASSAINLDGGGSSQLNSREPGDERTTIRNSPSDGYERRDANGLGIFLTTPGTGEVVEYDLRTGIDVDDAVRVFPGLTRSVTAVGIDETGSPASAAPSAWTSSSPAATVVAGADCAATVRGAAPGTATVTAATGAASGSVDVTVLGELDRLTASAGLVAFGAAEETRTLTITGHDANGFQAPIDPADIEIVDAPEGLLSFAPSADGSFAVTAASAPGGATIGFRVGDHIVRVPFTVGLREEVFADFANASSWTAANDRAPGGSVSPADGHEGAPGIRIAYDFTQSTATRGQYAVAPNGGVALPGQPQKVTAWIHGDGNGAWPRLQVRQANGTTSNLDGPNITWTGWRKAEFAVPAGVAYPLQFQRVRIMETRAAASYTGEVRVSGLSVALAPEVEMPVVPVVEDPIVGAEGSTADAPLRVAVMSDAQFVARNPDSEMVVGARRALKEIVAAQPDLLVINGDFVDEASPADFELAKRILEEELAGTTFPWYYVPGNHEIMGGAIDNFTAAFGPNFRTFDQQGTRFVLLDTSTGALSGSFAQIRMLDAALETAESDPSVTGVVVLQHHPIDDPLPTKASQLSNRLDASMLRDWLEEFRATSGKSVGLVASHVGVFHATREDGVPYLINGNSGKAPAGSEFGDFTGWTMLGIDPAQGAWGAATAPWLTSEVEARVDALRLGAEDATVDAGGTLDIDPVLDQPGRTDVEVEWPMSYRWSGEGVFVGSPADAPAGTVVAVDPAKHEFTAVRGGSADAVLTVNGVSETLSVDVPDTVRPTVTLVQPTGSGPMRELALQVDATDDVALDRIVANIYKDGKVFKSTQTAVTDAAATGTHTATVTLPDGAYTVKYNARDAAGNVSETCAFDVVIDVTKPKATIKDGASYTVKTGKSYDVISFKLSDAGKIDKVELNGKVKDLTNNQWSDVNFIKPGVFGAVKGANTLVVFDVAGNTETYTFTLD